MHAEVKKCVESNDIKGLKYIFADCFVVDPTFEKYMEDYEYCRQIPGIFEAYKELTPFQADKARWNAEYWEKLKMDLINNFSVKRFEHMILVAQVVYADKIARLLQERKAAEIKPKSSMGASGNAKEDFRPKGSVQTALPGTAQQKNLGQRSIDGRNGEALQEEELEKKRRELELENQKIEAEQRKQRERIAARKAELAGQSSVSEKSGSKKVLGIGLAAAAVIIIIILIQMF